MQKTYKEIVESCKLFEYQETAWKRYEVWTDTDKSWVCTWFNSNNSEVPSYISWKLN